MNSNYGRDTNIRNEMYQVLIYFVWQVLNVDENFCFQWRAISECILYIRTLFQNDKLIIKHSINKILL